MHLKTFQIRNFKSFEDVTLHLAPQVNVITGANNSGKTNVLEALALWSGCFSQLCVHAGKADAKLKIRAGDLRFRSHDYIEQHSLRSVRRSGAPDLFYRLEDGRRIDLIARLEEPALDTSIEVGFHLRTARGNMLELWPQSEDGVDFDYPRFNALFKTRRDVEALFASPVAALLFSEEFETPPKIARHVRSRESMLVLRNRLYQLRKQAAAYADFLRSCSQVLFGSPDQFALDFTGDEKTDVDLRVDVRTGTDPQMRDLSLLGSGALQLVELMLALHSDRRQLTIVLLDEPDSHLHRDVQRRLMDELRGAKNCQVFLSTHNESLLRSTRPEHILHLEGKAVGEERPIIASRPPGLKRGLQPSPHAKVLRSLGSETALDFVNALEADRLVLVEGDVDAEHIQALVDLQRIQWEPFRGMYWSFGGVTEIFQYIPVYRQLFESIRNGCTLWDKAVLVFDRDCFPDNLRERLLEQLQERLKIPVHIWESYTLEATLLAEPGKTVDLLTTALTRLVKATGSGATVERDRVAAQFEAVIQIHAAEWTKRLGGAHPEAGKWEKRAYGQIKERSAHLERSLGISILRGIGDADIQPKFREYALDHLRRGRIDHLTEKSEVLAIFNEVAQAFTVGFEEATYFGLLVEAAGPLSTWPQQWHELQRLLRARKP